MGHDFCRSAIHSYRQSTTNNFTIGNYVRFNVIMSGRTLEAQPETSDHLIEDQQCLIVIADLLKKLNILNILHQQSVICRYSFDDYSGYLTLKLSKSLLYSRSIVQRNYYRLFRKRFRNPCRRSLTKSHQSRTGLNQQ